MKRICDSKHLKPVTKMAIIDREALTIKFVDVVSFRLALDGLRKIRVQIFTEQDEPAPVPEVVNVAR